MSSNKNIRAWSDLNNIYARKPKSNFFDFDPFSILDPESGEVVDHIEPKLRLNGELLKRLHGRDVSFQPFFLPDIGEIVLPSISSFDQTNEDCLVLIKEFEQNGYVIYFKLSLFDLSFTYHYHLKDSQEDDYLFYESIARFKPVLVDGYMKQKDVFQQTVLLTICFEADKLLPIDKYTQGIKTKNKTDIMVIGTGLVDPILVQEFILYPPTYLDVTGRDVSYLTDVSSSTISKLKHGHKIFKNLTIESGMFLTQYAEIIQLDAWLLDNLMNESSNTLSFPVSMTLMSGEKLTFTNLNKEHYDALCDALIHHKPYTLIAYENKQRFLIPSEHVVFIQEYSV